MKTQPKSPIVIVTAVILGFSALAVARGADRLVPEGTVPSSRTSDAAAAPLCPPSACTIVFKTETGGPPSRIVHVD